MFLIMSITLSNNSKSLGLNFFNWLKLQLHQDYYLAQLFRYKYATSVRPHPSKDRAVNCFPSFLITWITSLSSICVTPFSLSFTKCWQLSAIWRSAFPLNPCRKVNVSYDLNDTEHTVLLIYRHYIYNCIN
jgi:hypothetical protein